MRNEPTLKEAIIRIDKAMLSLEQALKRQPHAHIKIETPAAISNQLTLQELENCKIYIKKLEEANKEASR